MQDELNTSTAKNMKPPEAKKLAIRLALAALFGSIGGGGLFIWGLVQPNAAVRLAAGAYFAPLLLGVALAARGLIRDYRNSAKGVRDYGAFFNDLARQIEKDKRSTGPISEWLSQIVGFVYFAFCAPAMALHLALIVKLKQNRLVNTASFVSLWLLSAIGTAFYLELSHEPSLALSICILATLCALSEPLSMLQRKNGVLQMFKQKAIFSPMDVLVSAFIVAIGFGGLHFHFSSQQPGSYSVRLTPFDAIYFSIVTFATVGYGDIAPVSHAAKLCCSIEVMAGIVMLVLAMNATVSVWLQKHQETVQPSIVSADVKGREEN